MTGYKTRNSSIAIAMTENLHRMVHTHLRKQKVSSDKDHIH